jgi:ferredoxin
MCEANAVCARLAPEIFSVDEVDGEDQMTIAADGDVPPELADRVREAVRSCPKMALQLEELATRLAGRQPKHSVRPGGGRQQVGLRRRQV